MYLCSKIMCLMRKTAPALPLLLLLSWLNMGLCLARSYTVKSPNGKIAVTTADGRDFQVTHNGKLLTTITAGINLNDNENERSSSAGLLPKGRKNEKRSGKDVKGGRVTAINETIEAPFYRQKSFAAQANQIDLRLDNHFGLQIRAYDEGVAYRFYTTQKGGSIISDETAVFSFPEDAKAWLSYSTNKERPFAMAFQNTYHETLIKDAQLPPLSPTDSPPQAGGQLPAFLPVTIQPDTTSCLKVTILESDLRSYPGMFLIREEGKVKAVFAPYPKKMDYYRWRGMSYVAETEDYIAKTTGPRTYPWRVLAITENDTEMPVNNLVYALATPNQTGDTSWIKPGKVAWDWWNDWNLKGVDFVAGINTDTYLYYIDFAAKNHIAYVVLDEGWYDSAKGDIMNPIAAIDLPRLVDYGQQRGVGIVLWTVFNVLDEHLEEACERYATMGIKGFKVDFLDRNDQTAVEMAERIAATCARHRLLLDYHGYFAPTGMSRTYPNLLNYEGVFGMEEARWAKRDTDMPRYDVTFPFIRMMAGQVDFTPGAMHNGTRQNWVECYQNPVSMGTRCHQLACYVVHDSPFTMLCDSPTNYEREQESVDIITSIPEVFDETRILQGEMGKYIVTARRKGNDWYVGGQTNWDGRDVTLPLDFLTDGTTYQATIVSDGINAHHHAEDYRIETKSVTAHERLNIRMASGGGFVVKLIKQ